ncbi:PDZ domain-containing protein [Candidatus Saganbacteria bacterium]|nr:PDZ domain-containing protein [Candidatus Saganbacteria bacterium]
MRNVKQKFFYWLFSSLLVVLLAAGCGQNPVQPPISATNFPANISSANYIGLNRPIVEAYHYFIDESVYAQKIPARFRELTESSLEAALLSDYHSIESFVRSLDDPYTRYLPNGTDQIDAMLNRQVYSGIGILFSFKNNTARINYVIPGSPAQTSGLRFGDRIMMVDEISVGGSSTAEIMALIRGAAGTTVKLQILRGADNLEFNIIRQPLAVKNAYGEMLPGSIGCIKLLQFGYSAAADFVQAYKTLGPLKGLVLDLRGNSGGELNSALSLTSLFVPAGKTIMWYKDKLGVMQKYDATPGALISLPLAVLIDHDSASAAEIFAGALIEQAGAVAVGTRTYGKGTMQVHHYLSDGAALYVTTAEFFTPTQQVISGTGITPRWAVDLRDDETIDVQLAAALNAVKELVALIKIH